MQHSSDSQSPQQNQQNQSSPQIQNPYNDLASDGQQIQYQEDNIQGNYIYGIHFCPTCQNMLYPDKASQKILQMQCRNCNAKKTIDFKDRFDQQCSIYNKQLQPGSKKSTFQQDFVFDPTMPRIKVACSRCDYQEAVYFLSPDDGQRKIVAKAMCANAPKCEHTWDLEQSCPIFYELNRKI